MSPEAFLETYGYLLDGKDSTAQGAGYFPEANTAEELYALAYYQKHRNTERFQKGAKAHATKKEKEALPKVTEAFKANVNQMSLAELEKAYPYLKHLYPGPTVLERLGMSETQRQQADYVLKRYGQLLSQTRFHWRHPNLMADYTNHIKETGINPITGKPASEGEKLMAEHYNAVQAWSTLGASLAGGYMDYKQITGAPTASVPSVSDDLSVPKKPVPKVNPDMEVPRSSTVAWEGTAWESTMDDLHHTMVTNNTPVVSNVHTVDEIAQQQTELVKVRNGEANLSTSMRKGNYGEIVQDEYYRQMGYERISKDIVTSLDSPSHKGIDGVCYNPDGHPPYIISEAKYNTATLGKAKDGKQMSRLWIDNRLDKAVNEEHATNIRKSLFIGDGNVQSNLFNVKENGNIIINQLDDAAKKMK
ncbi:hypothetical protein [Streptococcus oriscaviae]|uniref:hypothetical protein n=1 Tax=Streptococcus oriscaviae TaxID=2781599 RepID=UPI0020111414|nr:hypothetical protein [Streptococcus oriscaviae]